MITNGTVVFSHSNGACRRVTEEPAQADRLSTVEVELPNGRVLRQEDGKDLVSLQDGVATPLPGFQFDRIWVGRQEHFQTPRDDNHDTGLRINHSNSRGCVDGCQELWADGGGRVDRLGPTLGILGGSIAMYHPDGSTEQTGFRSGVGRVAADAPAMTFINPFSGEHESVEFYFSPASLGAHFPA